ncbi:MAG TPA: hypothetical protein VFP84_39475 [Kofleriaceae bacterium]|nr:hypothetical protein [Kofleriaceae bacterium]
MRGFICSVGLVIVSALTAGIARGDRGAARDAPRLDWAVGQLIAGGTGIADRHAPSPAVALGTSRRGAEEAAKRQLAARLGALPVAAGGTVSDKLGDPAVKARVDAALDAAIAIAAEPETDGSWHVTLALPLEAVRQAIGAPRALPAGGDRGPPVVIVDGVTARPALGWTINGASAATVWVKDVPAWAHDAPHVTARAARAGELTAPDNPGTPATLYLIVTRG